VFDPLDIGRGPLHLTPADVTFDLAAGIARTVDGDHTSVLQVDDRSPRGTTIAAMTERSGDQ
jgi:hypothetical protein